VKARILMRDTCADYNGCMTGWTYKSFIVDIPASAFPLGPSCKSKPQVIGAEWIADKPEDEVKHD